MKPDVDRLYKLLPAVYRLRDVENGEPLRQLLAIISQQVGSIEADLDQVYRNWFIETCADWVVPYLGDLIAFVPVTRTVDIQDFDPASLRALDRIESPRREIANTFDFRRRKGTLSVLAELAQAITGRAAVVVEFRNVLAQMQDMRQVRSDIGRCVNLRTGDSLELLSGPFAAAARTVDIRRINSSQTRGRYGIRGIGVFVFPWQLYSVTRTRASRQHGQLANCFTFSALGLDEPLFNHPRDDDESVSGEQCAPVPIRRRALAAHLSSYYGAGKSIQLWCRRSSGKASAIPASRIVVADLTSWRLPPKFTKKQVALDPVSGRLAFHPRNMPESVWASYWYGFSGDLGGGEYPRVPVEPLYADFYRVGTPRQGEPLPGREFRTLADALKQYQLDRKTGRQNAVIEICRSGVFEFPGKVKIPIGQSLQVRAARGARPLLRTEELPGGSHFRAATGSKLTLDGLTFFGAALNITGGLDMLRVRHCTVSPREYPPVACAEDRTNRSLGLALHLTAPRARVEVSLSILGPCTLQRDAAKTDPVEFYLRDSIWDDGRSGSCSVFQSDMGGSAYATLTAARITVRGAIDTHAIAAADNCLFDGVVQVARRQLGCMRFCYVPLASRTPRRYHCVPDTHGQPPTDDSLRPIFVSTHFGDPGYARLAPICPDAIRRGAEDLGELGGFHDLFLSQRLSNLQTRLDEFVPAGASAGVFLTD